MKNIKAIFLTLWIMIIGLGIGVSIGYFFIIYPLYLAFSILAIVICILAFILYLLIRGILDD